jgi:hypothetical protein
MALYIHLLPTREIDIYLWGWKIQQPTNTRQLSDRP